MLCAAAQAATNEGGRLAALRTIFPAMQVSIDRTEKINDSRPERPHADPRAYPDALAGEEVYRVIGRATNEAEKLASEDMNSPSLSNSRRVRFKLFRWPREGDAGLLAVLQYDFVGARPAISCPSIGLLVHLVKNAAKWQVRDRFLLETSRHFSLQKIQLLDLTGDGVDALVIESDFGGAGSAGSSLQVFDLSGGSFHELFNGIARLECMDQEGYTQVLDTKPTLQSQGRQFCVMKTTIFEKGQWFPAPHVTHPCYQRGHGVDRGADRQRNKLLRPLVLHVQGEKSKIRK